MGDRSVAVWAAMSSSYPELDPVALRPTVAFVDRGALQSALWDATNDCIPEPRRVELLLEDWKDAKVGVERCRQDIDSLRQRSMPAWRK